ncbi:DUF4302 domain-containing protein [Flavobacterium sp. CLA17]|uniref:DUF4302 domain-containing protein n=1 Tax=Flavobacterium sp. CLA17 TaxID=2724135 RepID=UPI0014930117|nr:DUF4302 domain-containing protein [Flavobacterium sp. CLA17]QSB26328.1 DUF4302 domain-containing protein [Flavobacterium sp. CLA17]
MKIKNIFKFLIIAFLATQLGACDKNEAEQKFEKTPTERINAQKKELNDVLLSSEFGWKAVYYTDNTQLGGFTHLFKFSADGKVAMASDFDSDTSIYNSDYSIEIGSTVSLLFSTKNRIHLLSDSNNSPTVGLKGRGYKGDFQFLYYGQENGEIIFKTNRSFQELRFIKATAEDWTDLELNTKMAQNVIGSDKRPLFRLLEINDGTDIHKLDFNYASKARFATANSVEQGYGISYNMGIAFTKTGISVSPAVEVNNQQLTEFIYDDGTGDFTATGTNGVSATIKYSKKPLILTDDYKLLLPGGGNNVYAYMHGFTESEGPNSELFLSLLGDIEKASGVPLIRAQFWFNNIDGTNYIEYRSGDDQTEVRYYHFFTIKADDVNKTVTFIPGVWKSSTAIAGESGTAPEGPAISRPSFLKALDDEFMNPNGLYFAEIPTTGYRGYTFTSTTTHFRMVASSL